MPTVDIKYSVLVLEATYLLIEVKDTVFSFHTSEEQTARLTALALENLLTRLGYQVNPVDYTSWSKWKERETEFFKPVAKSEFTSEEYIQDWPLEELYR